MWASLLTRPPGGRLRPVVELERANLFLIPLGRPPRVVSLPRAVCGRAPVPAAPERFRARPCGAPPRVRVARARGPPVRSRASRRRRRRARERNHIGAGRQVPFARAGRRRRDPPPARGTSFAERGPRCATCRRQGLGAERPQPPRRLADRARVGGVGPMRTGHALRPPVRGCDRVDPRLLPLGGREQDAGRWRRASELLDNTFSIGSPVSLLALAWARLFTGECEAALAPLEQASFLAARRTNGSSPASPRRCSRGSRSRLKRGPRRVDGQACAEHPRGSRRRRQARRRHRARGPRRRPRPQKRARGGGEAAGSGRGEPSGRGQPLDIADALLLSASVRRALEAPAPARAMLEEARELLASCPDPGVLGARLVDVARTLTGPPSNRG